MNASFAIYDRTNDAPLSIATLRALVGAGPSDDVFDPQVIWDPGTSRFYYVADDVVAPATDNRLAFGFSKTDSPSSAADWCKYTLAYGSAFSRLSQARRHRRLPAHRGQRVQRQQWWLPAHRHGLGYEAALIERLSRSNGPSRR